MTRIDAALAAGWPLDGILFNLGVNDVTEGQIVFNTSATFSNLTEICQVLIEKYGKPTGPSSSCAR